MLKNKWAYKTRTALNIWVSNLFGKYMDLGTLCNHPYYQILLAYLWNRVTCSAIHHVHRNLYPHSHVNKHGTIPSQATNMFHRRRSWLKMNKVSQVSQLSISLWWLPNTREIPLNNITQIILNCYTAFQKFILPRYTHSLVWVGAADPTKKLVSPHVFLITVAVLLCPSGIECPAYCEHMAQSCPTWFWVDISLVMVVGTEIRKILLFGIT